MTSLLTAFVPPRAQGTTTFLEETKVNGDRVTNKYETRIYRGWHVVDISLGFFHRLLAGPHGLDWQNCNYEIMQWLGEADRRDMLGSAFPGIDRAPAPPPAPPAPVFMVRMAAPAGVTCASIDGNQLVIGKDGTIEVTNRIADVLRSHGFVEAA